MGWIKKFVNAVASAVAPVPMILGKVATGQKPADAVVDTVTAPVRLPLAAAAQAAGVAGDIDATLTKLEAALIAKVAGDGARKLFLDLRRVTVPVDARSVDQIVQSAHQFVETLDPQFLNPFGSLVAAELQRVRDAHWDRGSNIPDAVILAMPSDLATLARSARCLPLAEVNELALPTFAIDHFGQASAVTCIDLIVFKAIPGATTTQNLHYWAHELTHVQQFQTLGVPVFCARYVNQTLFSKVPELEAEADRQACKSFPGARPHYGSSCRDV